MVIRFLCPNGHKIHCADDRAGKAAKCPKCGVKFQVPEVSEIEASASSDELPVTDDSGSSTAIADAGPPATAEAQIQFLCPNGHLLHGPASLQGRPGQCPECGSKFRIPSYEDQEEEDQEVGQPVDVVDAEEGSAAVLTGVEEEQPVELQDEAEAPAVLAAGEPGLPETAAEDRVHAARGAPAVPPGRLAQLFGVLWSEKSRGAVIELGLEDGTTIVPDRFAEDLSQGSHAVVAVSEADGTYTLTAVAWQSIVRVTVRGVKQLPDGMLA